VNIVDAAEITTIFLDALLRNLDRKVVQDIIVSEAMDIAEIEEATSNIAETGGMDTPFLAVEYSDRRCL